MRQEENRSTRRSLFEIQSVQTAELTECFQDHIKIIVHHRFMCDPQLALNGGSPWKPAQVVHAVGADLLVPGEQVKCRFKDIVVKHYFFSFNRVPLFEPGAGKKDREIE